MNAEPRQAEMVLLHFLAPARAFSNPSGNGPLPHDVFDQHLSCHRLVLRRQSDARQLAAGGPRVLPEKHGPAAELSISKTLPFAVRTATSKRSTRHLDDHRSLASIHKPG